MPPVISNLVYTATDSTIVATWTTDISSDSNLSAGGKAAIDNGVAASGTSHQCIVTGLSPGNVYSCFVTSGGTSSSPQNVTTANAQTRIPITGVTFGFPTRIARRGDTILSCVSNDNNTYVTQDDGFGFGAADNAGANMQIGRLTNEATLTGVTTNLLTTYGAFSTTNGTDGPGGVALSNKLSGIFGMNGSLFAFQTRQDRSNVAVLTQFFGNIMRSDDHGATWNSWQNPAVFNANGIPPSPLGSSMFSDSTIGWIAPCRYAVDDGTLGYNTAGNQIDGANGFVYLVFTDGHWNNGSALYLMRVPRIQMAAQVTTAFQYWNGPGSPTPADFVNDANWSNVSSSKVAIFSATNQASAPDMVFVPALNYYLLLTWYQPGGGGVTSSATWNIMAAPTPAGPWTTVGTKNYNPAGYYNPAVLHRTVSTNVKTQAIPLTVVYSGDYNNQATYYAPTWSTLTLFTGGSMAPAIVNFVTGGSTSVTITTTSSNFSSTTGNCLVACVRSGVVDTDVTSVKNAAGVSFTAIASSTANAAAQSTKFWFLNNITGNATDNVTAAHGSSGFWAIAVWEISGQITASVQDTGAQGVVAGAGTQVTSGSFTTAQAIEIILTMGGLPTVNNTYSFNNGYAVDSDGFPAGASARYCGAAHLISTSRQIGVTETITGTVSGSGSTISVATFKAAFYNISGNAGVAGATVTLSGAGSGSTTADGSGNYTLSGFAPGAYTVTPSKTGYSFSPVNSSQTITAADIASVNFTATLLPTGAPSTITITMKDASTVVLSIPNGFTASMFISALRKSGGVWSTPPDPSTPATWWPYGDWQKVVTS